MNNKEYAIIFDCDGTVLDTYQLIIETVYQTFAKMLPDYPLTYEEADAFFGPLLDDTFSKYATNEKQLNELIECYRVINNRLMQKYIKAFPGISNLLQTLKARDYKIAIVSNKVTDAVIKGLDICKLTPYFDLIIGAEKLKAPKPNPDGIYQVLQKFDMNSAIMIGDTIIDIDTGNNAKVKTIGVTWCRTSKEEFLNHYASYVVDDPQKILKIIEEL